MLLNQKGNWEAWDPFREMNQLQREMNHLFSGVQGSRSEREFPQFNVWEDMNGLLLTTELPGAEPQDIDIVVVGDILTLKGNKKAPAIGEKVSYFQKELFYGDFSRSIKLPYRVDPDKVEAKFKNGVLTINLDRPEEEKPKKITISCN